MHILKQTQLDRDKELAKYTGLSLDTITSWQLGSLDSKLVLDDRQSVLGPDGKPDSESVIDLYRSYKFMDPYKYMRTVMRTSAISRPMSLSKFMKKLKNKTVLDFGSGTGTHAIALLEMGCKVDLLDVDGPLRALAEWRIKYRRLHRWSIMDHDTKLSAEYYDAVLCVAVLEHILHPAESLSRILDSLKIGGKLYIEMGKPKIPRGHLQESWDEWVGKCARMLNNRCSGSYPLYSKRK